MLNILFLAAHRPNRSPGQRYRFEQYFPYLKSQGINYKLSYIITEADDAVFYSGGTVLDKFRILIKSILKRYAHKRDYNNYDIVFVQREALMIGWTFFERSIKKSKAKFVFDFDDSIWLLDTSVANKKFEWLKNPEKTAKIIRFADCVFAGNAYLANYAKHYNTVVKIVPTTIDTDIHFPNKTLRNKGVITIGWSGSSTTIKHFEYALDFLTTLKQKYGSKINIVVMGDASYVNETLGIKGVEWSAEGEVTVLNTFDIGIMPLPNDEWAKGKCGLKGLSYMALEIATVMSPVGVNTEIIQHGINGFLANTHQEWVTTISAIIDDAELRKNVGKAARLTVIEKYSVLAQRDNYITYFKEVLM
ncbi:MAG: glycosyltransferase [Bacteroidia bacterium]|nr:glycosyltransferase [Bacteroidia bacterium]